MVAGVSALLASGAAVQVPAGSDPLVRPGKRLKVDWDALLKMPPPLPPAGARSPLQGGFVSAPATAAPALAAAAAAPTTPAAPIGTAAPAAGAGAPGPVPSAAARTREGMQAGGITALVANGPQAAGASGQADATTSSARPPAPGIPASNVTSASSQLPPAASQPVLAPSVVQADAATAAATTATSQSIATGRSAQVAALVSSSRASRAFTVAPAAAGATAPPGAVAALAAAAAVTSTASPVTEAHLPQPISAAAAVAVACGLEPRDAPVSSPAELRTFPLELPQPINAELRGMHVVGEAPARADSVTQPTPASHQPVGVSSPLPQQADSRLQPSPQGQDEAQSRQSGGTATVAASQTSAAPAQPTLEVNTGAAVPPVLATGPLSAAQRVAVTKEQLVAALAETGLVPQMNSSGAPVQMPQIQAPPSTITQAAPSAAAQAAPSATTQAAPSAAMTEQMQETASVPPPATAGRPSPPDGAALAASHSTASHPTASHPTASYPARGSGTMPGTSNGSMTAGAADTGVVGTAALAQVASVADVMTPSVRPEPPQQHQQHKQQPSTRGAPLPFQLTSAVRAMEAPGDARAPSGQQDTASAQGASTAAQIPGKRTGMPATGQVAPGQVQQQPHPSQRSTQSQSPGQAAQPWPPPLQQQLHGSQLPPYSGPPPLAWRDWVKQLRAAPVPTLPSAARMHPHTRTVLSVRSSE